MEPCQLDENCYSHRRHGIQLKYSHFKEPNQAPERVGKGRVEGESLRSRNGLYHLKLTAR